LQAKDLIHFIPALLYIFDFAPLFALSGAEKVRILKEDYSKGTLYSFSQSWVFPGFFHFYFRAILAFGYLFFMAKLWVNHFYNDSDFRKENKSLMQWTAVLILLLTIEITPSLIMLIFRIPINVVRTSNILSYGITACFTLFLIFKPEILYGVKGLWVNKEKDHDPAAPLMNMVVESSGTGNDLTETLAAPKKVYLKEEVVNKIGAAIENVLMERKSFLTQGYSLPDLSADTGYSTHQLSAFLNNHLGVNFNEYVNNHRVKFLLEMLNRDDSWQRFTLQALGEQVGFSNRFSFLSAFKKVTGENPSNYLRGLRKKNDQH